MPGLVLQEAPESASQDGAQPLRHRLVEDVIIERVEEVFSIGVAGKKIANIAVDRRRRYLGLQRNAFYGEVHGELLVPKLDVFFVTFGAGVPGFGHARCLTDDKKLTVCNTVRSHAQLQGSYASLHGAYPDMPKIGRGQRDSAGRRATFRSRQTLGDPGFVR